MPQSNLTLASLIGSRICHDLISPIGAISNGLELMAMSETAGGAASSSPEMALITQSVENANSRIRFFRVTYGIASVDQKMARSEITSLLEGVTKDSRIDLEWHPAQEFQRREIQAVFLAFQCLESAMAFGGVISISHEGGIWQITGSSEKLRIDTPLWAQLATHGAPPLAPAQVQFLLLPATISDLGRSLETQIDPQKISLRF